MKIKEKNNYFLFLLNEINKRRKKTRNKNVNKKFCLSNKTKGKWKIIYLFIYFFSKKKKRRFLFDFYIFNIYHIYTTNYFSSEHVLLNFSVKLISYLFSFLNTKICFLLLILTNILFFLLFLHIFSDWLINSKVFFVPIFVAEFRWCVVKWWHHKVWVSLVYVFQLIGTQDLDLHWHVKEDGEYIIVIFFFFQRSYYILCPKLDIPDLFNF